MAPYELLSALLAIFVISRVVKFVNGRKRVGYLSGLRCLVSPVSVFGASLPTSRLNPGLNWQWEWRNQVYSRLGVETISVIPYLFGGPSIYTSSIEVARQVVATKGEFFKAPNTTAITRIWGPNMFAAEGDEWRKHRRIISPAFSSATFDSVWRNTARVFDEMALVEGWSEKLTVEIPAVNDLTFKVALILIATCGFGNPLTWDFDKQKSAHAISFGEALTIISNTHIARLLLPNWSYHLPIKRLHKMDSAYRAMLDYMHDLIEARRRELTAGGVSSNDVLSLMIQASENEGKYAMDDSELTGNTFLLLSAGHDTTAHTLDAALGFLGLHEDIQEDVCKEIMDVMPTEANFTYENSTRLVKTRACFLEASRLFPAGFMMIRDAAEDVVLRNVGPNRDEQLALPRGTRVVVDVIGIHHNPRLFSDPEAFRPERWYDARDSDLTMFSVGARACIGRKFAITEGTCFLAKLLRDWKVEIIAGPGESKEQWRARVMRGRPVMNFGVGTVPIRLVRRC